MQENYIGLKYLPAFFRPTSVNLTKKDIYINAAGCGVTLKINYSTSFSLIYTSYVNSQPLPVPI